MKMRILDGTIIETCKAEPKPLQGVLWDIAALAAVIVFLVSLAAVIGAL